jgi:hypothetical protein
MLSRRLEELGLSAVAVLRHSGFSIGLFEQERIPLTTEDMFALYDANYKVSYDPGIGLKFGT